MKPSVLGLAVLLLAACSETNSRDRLGPIDDAGTPPGDSAAPPEDEDDAAVVEPKSLLPRPPGELPRPPVDGKLPSELRPPVAD